jgi:hypothetical protein
MTLTSTPTRAVSGKACLQGIACSIPDLIAHLGGALVSWHEGNGLGLPRAFSIILE